MAFVRSLHRTLGMSVNGLNISATPTKIVSQTPAIGATSVGHHQRRGISVFGYTQAKALVYSGYGNPKDVLRLHSHSISPTHGEKITVRFLASPINPADINQIEGVYPAKPPFTTTLGTIPPAAVAGNEGVCEVVAVGSKASGFKPGDWAVMRHSKFGTWRTFASAMERDLIKIPNDGSISPIQAAISSVNPCTAYRMLRDFGSLKPGEWFIQNGANSGVGRAAIQLGRRWQLNSINVVRTRPEIMELKKELKELGADVVITEEELASHQIIEQIDAWTAGKGTGLGLNCVGGDSATNIVRRLRAGGHMVTYGAMARKPIMVPASSFIFKDVHLHGFWISAWGDKHPQEKEKMLQVLFEMIKSGDFKEPPVEKVIWTNRTSQDELRLAIEKSQQGFGGKKHVFVMQDT